MSGIFDIITVGSNVVDIFVRTDPEESELFTIKHSKSVVNHLCFLAGSKILITKTDITIGGGGTNTATTFARLGLKTGYIGKMGKDDNGLKVYNLLKKENIEFLGSLGDMNGYSVIIDSVGDDRTVLTYKGCNDTLSFKELNKKKIDAKAYYLCSMMKESFKTAEKIAQHAHKHKREVAFNPSSYIAKKGITHVKNLLKHVTFIVLNDEEAHLLTGKEELKEMALVLHKTGPKTVLITRGGKGAFAYHNKKFYEGKPAAKRRILETTGAGDAFGSSTFAGLIMNKPFEEALKMGFINAESVITHYGAKNRLLSKNELTKKLTADKREIKVM